MSEKSSKLLSKVKNSIALTPDEIYDKHKDIMEFNNISRIECVEASEDIHMLLNDGYQKVILWADIKLGKLVISIHCALSIKDINGEPVTHWYILALRQKDTDCQLVEAEACFNYQHGAKTPTQRVFSGPKGARSMACLTDQEYTDKHFKTGRHILHIDECDYATGKNASIYKLFQHMKQYPNVSIVGLSATPTDAVCNTYSDDTATVYLKHNKDYRNFQFFTDHLLTHDAHDFFNTSYALESDGLELIEKLALDNKAKVAGVLRVTTNSPDKLTYSDIKDNKHLIQAAIDKQCKIIDLKNGTFDTKVHLVFIDGNESFIFDKNGGKRYNSYRHPITSCFKMQKLGRNHRVMFIMNQCSKRATQWWFHFALSWTHDARGASATWNTKKQAQGRACHHLYKTKEHDCPIIKEMIIESTKDHNGECLFHIYGDKEMLGGKVHKPMRVKKNRGYSIAKNHENKIIQGKDLKNVCAKVEKYKECLTNKGIKLIHDSTFSWSIIGQKRPESNNLLNLARCVVTGNSRGTKKSSRKNKTNDAFVYNTIDLSGKVAEINWEGKQIEKSEEFNKYLKDAIENGDIDFSEGSFFAIVEMNEEDKALIDPSDYSLDKTTIHNMVERFVTKKETAFPQLDLDTFIAK